MVCVYILRLAATNGTDKWFVGKSADASRISLANCSDESVSGAMSTPWTRQHKPVSIYKVIHDCDDFDDDKYTLKQMEKYGILNVRGGSFSAIVLEKDELLLILRMLLRKNQTSTNGGECDKAGDGTLAKCMLCGGGDHNLDNCSAQQAEWLTASSSVTPGAEDNVCKKMVVEVEVEHRERAGHRESKSRNNANTDNAVASVSGTSTAAARAARLGLKVLSPSACPASIDLSESPSDAAVISAPVFDTADELVAHIKACEARMKAIKTNAREKDKIQGSGSAAGVTAAVEVAQLNVDLRGYYMILLLNHTNCEVRAAAGITDMHGTLWKTCFYQQIEEYRKSMRKCVAVLGQTGAEAGPGSPIDPQVAQQERAKHHLVRLVTSFDKFLSDGIVFYSEFLLKAEKQIVSKDETGSDASFSVSGRGKDERANKRDRVSVSLAIKSAATTNTTAAILSSTAARAHRVQELVHAVYRCLLYLGDLARYRKQNDNSSWSPKDKDYSEAHSYYERASFVDPHNGNPHNQLAVLAGYGNSDCVAVYYYCRSVMTRQPFLAGFDNLALLFEKNAKHHRRLPAGVGHEHEQGEEPIDGDHAKIFLLRFVRLHGRLYEWSRSAYGASHKDGHRAAATVVSECNPMYIDCTQFQEDVMSVLDQYDAMLAHSRNIFGQSLLLKLLVLCIFSIHDATVKGPGGWTARDQGYAHARTTGESLALIVMYSFVQRTAAKVNSLLKKWNAAQLKQANRLLVVLSVVSDWFTVHPQYLVANSMSLNGGVRANVALFSNAKVISSEAKARSGMRSAIVALKLPLDALSGVNVPSLGAGNVGMAAAMLNKAGNGTSNAKVLWKPASRDDGKLSGCTPANNRNKGEDKEKDRDRGRDEQAPLWEHIELRGFLPLADTLEELFMSRGQQGASTRAAGGMAREPAPAIGKIPLALSEEASRDKRYHRIRSFIRDWVQPCAQREAEEADGRRMQAVADASVVARNAPLGQGLGQVVLSASYSSGPPARPLNDPSVFLAQQTKSCNKKPSSPESTTVVEMDTDVMDEGGGEVAGRSEKLKQRLAAKELRADSTRHPITNTLQMEEEEDGHKTGYDNGNDGNDGDDLGEVVVYKPAFSRPNRRYSPKNKSLAHLDDVDAYVEGLVNDDDAMATENLQSKATVIEARQEEKNHAQVKPQHAFSLSADIGIGETSRDTRNGVLYVTEDNWSLWGVPVSTGSGMGTNVGAEMGMDMDMDKKLNMGAPPGFDSDVLPLSRSASGGIGLSSVDVNNWWEPQKVCGDENGLDPGGNWQSGSGYGPGLGDGDGDDVGPPPGLGLQALTGMGMGTGTGTGRELVKEKERGRTWTSNPFFNLGDR